MTPTERAAYNAGIKAVINATQIVALTIETAEDAWTFRKRIAAETPAAFAESARGLMLTDQPGCSITFDRKHKSKFCPRTINAFYGFLPSLGRGKFYAKRNLRLIGTHDESRTVNPPRHRLGCRDGCHCCQRRSDQQNALSLESVRLRFSAD